MKYFFKILLVLALSIEFAYANEGIKNLANKNCATGDVKAVPIYDCGGIFFGNSIEDDDPLEPLNRGIFWVNQGIDYVLIEPIAWAYSEIIPEYGRDRISNILRNLNEPVVLVNNLLQGELEDGRDTIWRFVFNSTIGVAGIFDVSTDLGIPYKKEDLGLTLASWGFGPGPYLVLPILGPSNMRDGWGRLGDFAVDPINWWTFGLPVTGRTAVQVLDAKTDNINVTDEIKKNSIDYYASIRTWYTERRLALTTAVEDRQAVDTPRPDEDEDEIVLSRE
ncbi:MAG: VacJ family lipoprotein [Alphaproteobacteria bacterium]|nr:VacJ family lipoprotein [Alphaproteobacteria bacterium]